MHVPRRFVCLFVLYAIVKVRLRPAVSLADIHSITDHRGRQRRPCHLLVEAGGFEPPTPCLQSRCSPAELRPLGGLSAVWWALVDSNHRPRPYQGRALTN